MHITRYLKTHWIKNNLDLSPVSLLINKITDNRFSLLMKSKLKLKNYHSSMLIIPPLLVSIGPYSIVYLSNIIRKFLTFYIKNNLFYLLKKGKKKEKIIAPQ